MGGRAISENRTGSVSVLLSEKERSSGRDGKRGQRHDPETKRRRIYEDIRSGRGRVGGKAVENGSYSNNYFSRVIRRRGIFSHRRDADYIRVRE